MADRGGKRKHDGGKQGHGGGGDNKKRYWSDPSKVQGIPLGTRGILVSCITGKESYAGREAANVLSEAYEALRPSAAVPAAASSAPSDISALLAGEVAELKDRSKQPFAFRTIGIGSMVYVEVKYEGGPSPSELVMQACRRARDTQQNTTRLCQRFYPIERTCAANASEMASLAAKVAAEHFPADAAEGIAFAVDVDKRAAPPKLDRMEVIHIFANAVAQPPHKVNLGAPRKCILVNVVKGTCGVSVVEEYRELAKLNILTLTMPPEGEAGSKAEGQEAPEAAAAAVEGDRMGNVPEEAEAAGDDA